MRWFALIVLCSSCKCSKAPLKHDDARPSPADVVVADAPVDAAIDAPAMSTVITSDAVGPLTVKATDEEAFKKLLPSFAIKTQHREAEAYNYEEIIASKDGKRTLRAVVNGGKLFKIAVDDATFTTEHHLAVGMTVADLAARMADLKCAYQTYDPEADAEHVDRALRCQSQSLPRILFEIDLAGFAGKFGDVGPKTIATRKIIEIIWLAPQE